MRTDKPLAELYLYRDEELLVELKWEAHRQLAETLHQKIDELLSGQSMSLEDISKICVYQGPGSFTGLRIGISVANALAYSLNVPIAGAEGDDWLEKTLSSNGSENPAVPHYGSDPHITKQKR